MINSKKIIKYNRLNLRHYGQWKSLIFETNCWFSTDLWNLYVNKCVTYLYKAIEIPALMVKMLEDVVRSAALQPSLLLHWQYSINILYVPVRIKQNRSSPTIPGSPINAQLRKYRHSPFTVRQNKM